MSSSDVRAQRAQLWALYFGLLALSEPPPFLARAREELRELLEGGVPPSPARVSGRAQLRIVK